MKKDYLLFNVKITPNLLLLIGLFMLANQNSIAQCSNYQVYESIGTGIPTNGGTWTATSMTYGTGNARTGSNNLVFDAAGDAIRTPLISNPGVFSFWYARSNNSTAHSFNIQTSPDGTTWTSRGTTSTPTTTYQQFSVNLGALSLTNVYVRILDTRASGAHARYVDDISWTSTVTSNNTIIPALANCSQTVTCGTTYTFSDAGTDNDTYNSSSDYTITFTPSVGTNKIQLAFSAFNTESGYDGMVIYNGPNTASPIISSGLGVGTNATNCPAGSYYGTTSPGTVTSTDASGSITIRFRSDGTTNNAGWLASVSCVVACTTPTAQPTVLSLTQPSNGTINGSFTAASPAPTNYLVVYNTTGATPSPVNGTTYTVGGTVGSGNTVADIDTNTTFSVTGLNPSTQYYFFIFSYNTGCAGGPLYLTTSPLTGSATTPFFYCTAYNPTNTTYYISGITTTGGITNISNTGTGFSTGGYYDYSSTYSVSQYQGSGFSITATHPSSTYGYSVWVDWNGDGDFLDAGESVISTGYLSSPASVGTITVPLATPAGNYRMRIRNAYLSNPPTACGSHDYGEAEDYTITVIALPPCTTPSTQPTSLSLSSITSASINGSFSAASPAPSGYLIVRSTSATAPALANGTTYAIGYTGLTPGTTYVVQGSAVTSNATSFSDTGLTSNTRYYYYIFSYNNTCSGAPYYLATSPLTQNNVTCAATPTSPVNSGITTSGFTISWTASVAGGGAGAISYTLEIFSDSGYTTPIAGSPFSLGATTTYTASGLAGGTYYYRIKASNGFCDSTYLTGSVGTIPPNNQCSTATTLACGTTNLSGSTVNAASYTHGTGCTMSNNGVWYTFTGNGGQNTVSVTTSSFDVEMAIVSGSCGSLTNVTCQDSALSSGTETYTFTATSGVTYYVYVAYYGTGTTTGTFTISRTCIAPLTNDDCGTAISLTPTTTCSYSYYTNTGANASAGVTAPGCASYTGADVWFSVVVPSTGEIDVDLQTGSLTDSGMAFYNGSCGSLTLLDCDDDSSSNGSMSYLSRTGLTPGQTIYIRVWGYSGATGTFGICVTTPSCPSPSDLYANILSTTSVTVNWNPPSPLPSGGYQYYISTTNTAPTTSSTPTGSTAPGVIGVTLTGLTPGQKYYFWVRSYCGGSDTGIWFGPTNYAPCAVGNGTGTTSLSCPSVTSGGLGLNGGDPVAMSCQALTCVDLEATYLTLNQPTNYSVTSIPYSPPYQFSCLQNPVSVNVDDVWSPVINLPFNFCFYGTNYNKCLIGSNGTITFNTSGTGYTPGGYSGWSFSNNLPNTTLFLNTIFGVYHDIDPSKGGQVGWELITLNSGCRALVASWSDIPMYSSSCNSQLYTGMIVLYENTNVIEVYIKEKNVCGTWNDGNAVVGIQNAAGNAAVVAPNRNSLDANWTVTNEAWRFTPTGTTLTSLKWYQGLGTSGPVLGTTDTINVCPTSTTIYTAEVTYALCSGTNLKYTDNVVVTVTGTKIWNGSQSTDWNTNNNWTPSGVPTNANCVIIPATTNNPVISSAPNAVGYNLSVYNSAQLTMNANQNLTITDKITVQPSGTFTLNNNANLVQINDAAVNTGSIIYKRIAPNIKGSDYVYWSSPVASQNIGSIYDGTFPYTSGYKYQWNTTLNNNNGAGGNIGQGNWEAASGIMTKGRGYIIRGSSSFGMPANNIPTTFTGVPFNGIIPYTVLRGNYTGAPYNGANGVQITNLNDNYNLLGNPYPSSINALKFLQTNAYNASTNPTGQILGNVKLWTHGTDPLQGTANPFYGSFQYNYDANDYLTINYLGSTTPGSADLIRSGQAFFVQMVDGATGSGTVNFNNSMRYDGSNNPYSNSGFFKNAAIVNNDISLDRHRLWLDLVDSNSQSSGILVGYASNATNDYDNLFDAPTAIPGSMKLFSTIDNNTNVFEIQGRGLPFDINDEIPIGFNVPAQGNYSFAIAALDGLFESQNIYLKDNLLNITHDLKVAPYHFTTAAGVTKDRFKVVYVDNALSNTIHPDYENSVFVITNTEEVMVNSSLMEMSSIEVYNLLGQKLNYFDKINSTQAVLSGLHKNNTTLLLKIKLQSGQTVIKKILY